MMSNQCGENRREIALQTGKAIGVAGGGHAQAIAACPGVTHGLAVAGVGLESTPAREDFSAHLHCRVVVVPVCGDALETRVRNVRETVGLSKQGKELVRVIALYHVGLDERLIIGEEVDDLVSPVTGVPLIAAEGGKMARFVVLLGSLNHLLPSGMISKAAGQ